jgi:hypothetical protein
MIYEYASPLQAAEPSGANWHVCRPTVGSFEARTSFRSASPADVFRLIGWPIVWPVKINTSDSLRKFSTKMRERTNMTNIKILKPIGDVHAALGPPQTERYTRIDYDVDMMTKVQRCSGSSGACTYGCRDAMDHRYGVCAQVMGLSCFRFPPTARRRHHPCVKRQDVKRS